MFICMYISCNTLGSWKRSFLTLENYCTHLSGHLKVQSVYLCIKKCCELYNAEAKLPVIENVISLFIHAITSLCCETLFGGVLRSEEIRFCWWNQGMGLYCSSYAVKARIHCFKTASPVANSLVLFTGDSNGLYSYWSDLGQSCSCNCKRQYFMFYVNLVKMVTFWLFHLAKEELHAEA